MQISHWGNWEDEALNVGYHSPECVSQKTCLDCFLYEWRKKSDIVAEIRAVAASFAATAFCICFQGKTTIRVCSKVILEEMKGFIR